MRICFVLLILPLALACNDKDLLEPQPPPSQMDVNATTSNTFNPNPVTIAVGGTVRFVFGNVGHTVLFEQKNGVPADIIEVSSNKTESRTFSTVGQFPYECGVHDGMNGTIFVVAP